MAAPFIECMTEYQPSVVGTLWPGCAKKGDIYGTMTVHYGDSRVNQKKIYGWVEILTGGEKGGRKRHVGAISSK
jgi:hypothetical protein